MLTSFILQILMVQQMLTQKLNMCTLLMIQKVNVCTNTTWIIKLFRVFFNIQIYLN